LSGIATWLAMAAREVEAGDLDRRSLQRRSRRHVTLGEWALRRGYVREADRAAWRDRSIGFFTDNSIDLMLTPALAAAPPRAVAWSDRSWLANLLTSIRYAPYAAPWTMAGRAAAGRAPRRRAARRPTRVGAAAARGGRTVRDGCALAPPRARVASGAQSRLVSLVRAGRGGDLHLARCRHRRCRPAEVRRSGT
jgi:amidase